MNLGDLTLNIVLNSAGAASASATVTQNLNQVDTSMKKVSGTTGALNSALSSTGSSFSNFGSSLAKFGLAMNGIQFIYGMLKSTLGELSRSAMGAEVSVAKLTNGIKNVGEGSDALRMLTSQANQLKTITPFSKSEITNAQAMLTTFRKSSEEIAILTPRILDLSAAFMKNGESEMDVQRVAMMLGKVNEETIGTLRRYGVAFTSAEGEILKSLQGTEQANYLAKLLDSNFKNMAVTVGQTAPGQFKIFENYINSVKASLGRVINEALIPFLSPLKNILAGLAAAPPYFKTAAVAVTVLGVAFMTLGKNLSDKTKAVLLIAALMQGLPPHLRLTAGAIMALVGAFIALNGSLTVTNATLGGLPVVLGLIATGIMSVLTGLHDINSAASFDSISENISKTGDAFTQAQSSIQNLQAIQQQLANQSSLTAEQQAQLNGKIKDAISLYPQLITGVDTHTGALTTNDEALQKVIQSESDLNNIRQQKLIADEVKQINDLVNAHGSEIDKIESKRNKVDELNQSLNESQGWFSRFINGNKNSAVEVANTNAHISTLNNEIVNSAQYSADLQLKFDNAVKQGMKFGTLKDVINQLKPSLDKSAKSTEFFFQVMSSNLGVAINDWGVLISKVDEYNAAKNQQVAGPPAPPERTPNYLQQEISKLDESIGNTADKNTIKDLQKQKADLDKERKELLGETDKPQRTHSSRSSHVKEEKDAADELIKTWQRELDIFRAGSDAKIEAGKSELEIIDAVNSAIASQIYSQDQLLKFDKFRTDVWSSMKFNESINSSTDDPLLKRVEADVAAAREAYNKKTKYGSDKRFDPFDEVDAYRKALELEKKISDQKLTESDYQNLITAAKQKQKDLNLKEYEDRKKFADLSDDIKQYEKDINTIIEKRQQIENDIRSKSIEGISDEFLKRKEKIEEEYQLELQRIKKLEDISPRQRSDLTRLASDTRDRALRENDNDRRDKISDARSKAFNESLDLADAISQKLGEGAQSILSSFRQAYNFVVMIVELMKTLNTVSSLLNFIPGGGAIKAIAAGPAGAAGAGFPGGGLSGKFPASAFFPSASPQVSNFTIIPAGELTDHLTYKIVSRGTVINDVKIKKSTI